MTLSTKIKNSLIYSDNLASVYSFLTKPFANKLRHVSDKRDIVPEKPRKVSAIIPNYNYAEFISARIDSIVNQTYPIHELIILDDYSTDNSREIIESKIDELHERFPKLQVRFIKSRTNSGRPILQWYRAFQEASGDFVWIAEADDSSDERFLEKLMPFFDDKEVVLAYSDSVAINNNGKVLSYAFSAHAGRLCRNHFKTSYMVDGKIERKVCLNARCTIPNVSGVVFRNRNDIPFRKYLTEASKFIQVGDWYFYLKLASHGKFAFLRESLNFFRIHESSATKASSKTIKHKEEIEFIHKHLDMI